MSTPTTCTDPWHGTRGFGVGFCPTCGCAGVFKGRNLWSKEAIDEFMRNTPEPVTPIGVQPMPDRGARIHYLEVIRERAAQTPAEAQPQPETPFTTFAKAHIRAAAFSHIPRTDDPANTPHTETACCECGSSEHGCSSCNLYGSRRRIEQR
jgi:hypothetical protein